MLRHVVPDVGNFAPFKIAKKGSANLGMFRKPVHLDARNRLIPRKLNLRVVRSKNEQTGSVLYLGQRSTVCSLAWLHRNCVRHTLPSGGTSVLERFANADIFDAQRSD